MAGISLGDLWQKYQDWRGGPSLSDQLGAAFPQPLDAGRPGQTVAQAAPPPTSLTPQQMDLVSGLTGFGGILAGEGAATANLGALAKAKGMAEAGHDAPSIWQQTGWFKGPEGRWKFEIPDTDAKVGPTYQDNGFTMRAQTVGQAVQHPDLMAAYPDLTKARVAFDAEGAGKGAYYEPASGRPERIGLGPGSDQGTRGLMLHELQHAVQRREGFAPGGSVSPPGAEQVQGIRAAFEGKLGRPLTTDEIVRIGTQLQEAAHQQYRSLAGEAEARAVEGRANMTPDALRASFPLDSYDVPLDQLIMGGIQVGR